MNLEKLEQKFHSKIDKEYNMFIQDISKKETNVIIDRAYEIVSKEIIKDKLENQEFDEKELTALLKNENILDECYDEWMDTDANFGELIEYAVDERVERIIEDFENAA